MLDRFFAQPTWPVAVATLVAACITVILQTVFNSRNVRFNRKFQRHSALIAEQGAATALAVADLKKIELTNFTASKYAEFVEGRAMRLHDEFAELLGLIDIYLSEQPNLEADVRPRMAKPYRSIGLAASPRSAFAEELNIQLGHVREAVEHGPAYLHERPELLSALQLSAWKIVDAEYDRALESVVSGSPIA